MHYATILNVVHLPQYEAIYDDKVYAMTGQTSHKGYRLGTVWTRMNGTLYSTATRGLLATDQVILNHGQVTWTTPELAPPSPNYYPTPTGGRFSSRQIAALHGGSLAVLGSNS
ncbi:hypothetical protein TNCV_29551 [Trichonephila clavipes]|nr:hypothetical protein TNCV_29551 [Trichonephila clavipes]